MKHRIFAVVAAALVAFSAQSAWADKLRVATVFSFEPFVSFDSRTGSFKGFDVDLLTLLAKKNGHTVEFAAVPLGAVLQSVQNGIADIGAGALSITPERTAVHLFSDPYYEAGIAMMVPAKDVTIDNLADLRFHKLCVERNSTADELARTLNAPVMQLTSMTEVLLAFSRGSCDVVIGDRPLLEYYAGRAENSKRFKVLPYKLTRESLGFVFAKKRQGLVEGFNRALAEARKNGEYQALVRKWFKPPEKPEASQAAGIPSTSGRDSF